MMFWKDIAKITGTTHKYNYSDCEAAASEAIALAKEKGVEVEKIDTSVVAADVIVIPRSCSCSIQSICEAPSCVSPILWIL